MSKNLIADTRGKWVLYRVTYSTYGWAICNAMTGKPLVVDGSEAVGITKWEGRQVLGLLGLPYTVQEDTP